jgi:hypothetical protein
MSTKVIGKNKKGLRLMKAKLYINVALLLSGFLTGWIIDLLI